MQHLRKPAMRKLVHPQGTTAEVAVQVVPDSNLRSARAFGSDRWMLCGTRPLYASAPDQKISAFRVSGNLARLINFHLALRLCMRHVALLAPQRPRAPSRALEVARQNPRRPSRVSRSDLDEPRRSLALTSKSLEGFLQRLRGRSRLSRTDLDDPRGFCAAG